MAVGHLLCINTILATIEIYMAPIWAEDRSRQEVGKSQKPIMFVV